MCEWLFAFCWNATKSDLFGRCVCNLFKIYGSMGTFRVCSNWAAGVLKQGGRGCIQTRWEGVCSNSTGLDKQCSIRVWRTPFGMKTAIQ